MVRNVNYVDLVQPLTTSLTHLIIGPIEIHEFTEAVNFVIFGICRECREFMKMP
jgi:hypothetical protein